MSWLSGLISAGAGLVKGLFGGKSKPRPQVTTSHVDYQRLVREAEAAGFNPLTALRNGGSAGFAVSSTTGGGSYTPLSARLASGFAGAAQNFIDNYDPMKDQKRELEFKLMEAQLANLNASTASFNKVRFGAVPARTAARREPRLGSGVKHGQSFQSAADALPDSAGDAKTPIVQTPQVTNPFPKSAGLKIDPNVPDASAWEDRYGDSEFGSMIAGGSVAYQDYLANGGFPFSSSGLVDAAKWFVGEATSEVASRFMRDVPPLKRFVKKKLKGTRFENPPPLSKLVRDLVGGKDLPW